jgi:nucleotide-binding universal stress UspA family protein
MTDPATRCIVVGVIPRQADAVVQHAAALATQLGVRLICASVDVGRYTVAERADGSVRALPLDPDLGDLPEEEFDPALLAHLAEVLDPTGVDWDVRALAGDPARALGHLADTLDAMMIVVGTREGGFRGGLHEFFNGSVAVHLAHRQHRPVVVIPLAPVGLDGLLPWESRP